MEQPGVPFEIDKAALERFIASLPLQSHGRSGRVTAEIMGDLSRPVAMSSLLQGEVGSGKTVVALSALLMAVSNGFQGALMAPTEILAGQHFASVCRMLAGMGKVGKTDESLCVFSGMTDKPLTVALLISDVKGAAKKDLKERLSSGEIDIIIGTHALIQKEVALPNWGWWWWTSSTASAWNSARPYGRRDTTPICW